MIDMIPRSNRKITLITRGDMTYDRRVDEVTYNTSAYPFSQHHVIGCMRSYVFIRV